MKTPKPPKFVMYSDRINSRVTYSFFNLVVDPIKVSDTVQRFWKRHGSKLDDCFRGSNFHVEVYAYGMKTIAFLVREKDLVTVATSKATVREGDTYNATIGAEVAITSLLRKVANKDFRKISKEDDKIARKAYDEWLNSEKYNCGNPECKACNAATGKPVQLKSDRETAFGKPFNSEFVANLEYAAGRSGKVAVSEVKEEDYLAEIETSNGYVFVKFKALSGGRDIEKDLKVVDLLKEAVSVATYLRKITFRKISK